MENEVAQRFMETLSRIEASRDVDELARLFDDEAVLRRISQRRVFHGREGAREFFREYLHAFDAIESEFQNAAIAPGLAIMEWRSRGRLKHGERVDYEGVSVVHCNEAGRIVSFRTYYDPCALLGRPVSAKGGPESHPTPRA